VRSIVRGRFLAPDQRHRFCPSLSGTFGTPGPLRSIVAAGDTIRVEGGSVAPSAVPPRGSKVYTDSPVEEAGLGREREPKPAREAGGLLRDRESSTLWRGPVDPLPSLGSQRFSHF
jgi:hypothetical protein